MYESGAHRPTQLGPYESLAPLWRGKTSDFFLATDSRRADARKVVIKRLRAELLDDADFCAMFLDQATVAIDLRHPNIVECYEALDLDGALALVMEFLDGRSLARIRRRKHVVTAVPTSIHLRVLANVLDALHYLHEAKTALVPDGIIHGDVRPDNVFVTFDGRTKLLHAGIENAEATTGIIRQKLSYMSPERARGAPIDRRSDLFSVGVMLWEAATGLRFWQDWPDVAIFRRLCAEGVPLQSGWVPIGAREVFAVATRAISVNPGDRYQSAAEMKAALETVLAGSPAETSTDSIRAYMGHAFSEDGSRSIDVLTAIGDDDEVPTTLRVPPSSIAPVSKEATTTGPVARIDGPKRRRTTYLVIGSTCVVVGGALFGSRLSLRHDLPARAASSVGLASSPSACIIVAPDVPGAPDTSSSATASGGPPASVVSCAPVFIGPPGTSAGPRWPSKGRIPAKPDRPDAGADQWGI